LFLKPQVVRSSWAAFAEKRLCIIKALFNLSVISLKDCVSSAISSLVGGMSIVSKKNAHSTEEYDALINVFEKQTQRLSELVFTLLDMTNMNDGFENGTICLKDVFGDIVSELSHIADEKEVKLYWDCDNSVVCGNTDLLYRAFYNIVENGIKYNIDGGKVMINVKSDNKKIMVKIKDTGIGIPDEEKKNIFEPFYRVDKSRSRKLGGSGLGLSIVQSIIAKHNGTIVVTDNENCGTCLEITLGI